MAIGLWRSTLESLRQVCDACKPKLQKRLNKIAFGSSILTFYSFEDLARSDEAVACIRIGFVACASAVGVGAVVKQVLLDQDAESISKVSRRQRCMLGELGDGRPAFGKKCSENSL